MASELLLVGGDRDEPERWPLDEHDEEVLAPVLRELALHATQSDEVAVIHERHSERIAAWDREGALRLARALPPAYGELTEALVRRYEHGGRPER